MGSFFSCFALSFRGTVREGTHRGERGGEEEGGSRERQIDGVRESCERDLAVYEGRSVQRRGRQRARVHRKRTRATRQKGHREEEEMEEARLLRTRVRCEVGVKKHDAVCATRC